VTNFGLFVALDEVYVEGLLHVTELGNDYFVFDKARHEMLGERTGVRYRLGDRLTIKVARVDLETSKMDFTLVSNGKSKQVSDESASNKQTKQPVSDTVQDKKTLRVTKPVTERTSDSKPKTTRALEKAKKSAQSLISLLLANPMLLRQRVENPVQPMPQNRRLKPKIA